MNTVLKISLVLGVCLGLSSPGLAKQAEEARSSADDEVERITVYGRKTLPQLRNQIQKASLSFFKDYNKINDDHQYAMICKKERIPGSNFKATNCEPRFVKSRRSDMLATQLNSGAGLSNTTMFGGANVSKTQKKKFNDHLVKLLKENPELLQKFNQLAELKQEFVELSADR